MTAVRLVTAYGLRACPLGCAGRCRFAVERAHGYVDPAPAGACQLMSGPAPESGTMVLAHHDRAQLLAMAAEGFGADRAVAAAARRELDRRAEG